MCKKCTSSSLQKIIPKAFEEWHLFWCFYTLDAHDEEEARSEGSTGSEWLVIPEEKLPESREPISSPICLPSKQMYVTFNHFNFAQYNKALQFLLVLWLPCGQSWQPMISLIGGVWQQENERTHGEWSEWRWGRTWQQYLSFLKDAKDLLAVREVQKSFMLLPLLILRVNVLQKSCPKPLVKSPRLGLFLPRSWLEMWF